MCISSGACFEYFLVAISFEMLVLFRMNLLKPSWIFNINIWCLNYLSSLPSWIFNINNWSSLHCTVRQGISHLIKCEYILHMLKFRCSAHWEYNVDIDPYYFWMHARIQQNQNFSQLLKKSTKTFSMIWFNESAACDSHPIHSSNPVHALRCSYFLDFFLRNCLLMVCLNHCYGASILM